MNNLVEELRRRVPWDIAVENTGTLHARWNRKHGVVDMEARPRSVSLRFNYSPFIRNWRPGTQEYVTEETFLGSQVMDAIDKLRNRGFGVVHLKSLPEDMQVLIGDLADTYGPSRVFPSHLVPIEAFLEDPVKPGKPWSAEDVFGQPPVLLWGSSWVDGWHRVHRYEIHGVPLVHAIDIAPSRKSKYNRKAPYHGELRSYE